MICFWTIQTDTCAEMCMVYVETLQYKNKSSGREMFKVMQGIEKGAINTARLGREGIKKEAWAGLWELRERDEWKDLGDNSMFPMWGKTDVLSQGGQRHTGMKILGESELALPLKCLPNECFLHRIFLHAAYIPFNTLLVYQDLCREILYVWNIDAFLTNWWEGI